MTTSAMHWRLYYTIYAIFEVVSYSTAVECRYACYLLFSLKTHNQAFENHDDDEEEEGEGGEGVEGEKHEEVPVLSLSGAFLMLTSITVMVAVSSEYVLLIMLAFHAGLYTLSIIFLEFKIKARSL